MKGAVLSLALVAAAGIGLILLLKPKVSYTGQPLGAGQGMSDTAAEWGGIASIVGSLANAGASVANSALENQAQQDAFQNWADMFAATSNHP